MFAAGWSLSAHQIPPCHAFGGWIKDVITGEPSNTEIQQLLSIIPRTRLSPKPCVVFPGHVLTFARCTAPVAKGESPEST